jgi:hypothetical protein
LYAGKLNSCSARITQIRPIFLKSKPVVIIFVAMIISAFSRFSKAFNFSVLFLTESKSNLKILTFFFSKYFLRLSSICPVHTPIFFR